MDDSDAAKRSKVLAALKDPSQRNNRDHVDIVGSLFKHLVERLRHLATAAERYA